MCFEGLEETVVAHAIPEVVPALERIEREIAAGRHAAGFLAYEAASAFDPALVTHPPISGFPLLAFGIFGGRRMIDPLEGLPTSDGFQLGPLTPSIDTVAYEERISQILELIAAGDTYQVNLTFRLRGRLDGCPRALYRRLCEAQRAAFCAYLEVGDHALLSASPELFFHARGLEIELRPMKGTRPRGRWSAEDNAIAAELATSPKDRAENLMIVDLLRNDLGRVAEFGSVRVPALFEVERYPTVHQLTSSVCGVLRSGTGLADLLRAFFPSGSVTGAPKIRTAAIIRGLEDAPRGPYTGAIGFVSREEAVFSVAIRTLLLDRRTGSVEIGVGSGITADSQAADEYRECMEKGVFLRHVTPSFEILESLRLGPYGEFPLIDEHLERMAATASYFGYPFPEVALRSALAEVAGSNPVGLFKVRLLLARDGTIQAESESLAEDQPIARVELACSPVDEDDPFLYHKTTHRVQYDRAVAGLGGGQDGCEEVILWNRRGELTEATRANIVLEIGDELLTPPVQCGLLEGVMRGREIREGRIRTAVLRREDLRRADRIYLINAVRGWRPAMLVEPDDPSSSISPG
jgi:para-aminobenzoate synthetase / 4-amino-4-deoxychorismate lyase